MVNKVKRIGEMLVEAGLVSPAHVRAALDRQKNWGGRLGSNLVQTGAITEEALLRFFAAQSNVQELDLLRADIDPDVVRLLPHKAAEQFNLIPVRMSDKNTMIVACADPTDLNALDQVRFITGFKIVPAISSLTSILNAINHYYLGWEVNDEHASPAVSLLNPGFVKMADMESHGGKSSRVDPDLILFGEQGASAQGKQPTGPAMAEPAKPIHTKPAAGPLTPAETSAQPKAREFNLDFSPPASDNRVLKYMPGTSSQPKPGVASPPPPAPVAPRVEFTIEQKLGAAYQLLIRKGYITEAEVENELNRLLRAGKLT